MFSFHVEFSNGETVDLLQLPAWLEERRYQILRAYWTYTKEIETMLIKITPNDRGNPPGKLADAEIHFQEGPLEGLKLIGFSIWDQKRGKDRNVTFPARQYTVNGECRSFALLRPIIDTTAQVRIRDLILEAYAGWEEAEIKAKANDGFAPSGHPEDTTQDALSEAEVLKRGFF